MCGDDGPAEEQMIQLNFRVFLTQVHITWHQPVVDYTFSVSL